MVGGKKLDLRSTSMQILLQPHIPGLCCPNFENLRTRISVRIRRVRCEWRQLEAARKGDRNYLPITANVFFILLKICKNLDFQFFNIFYCNLRQMKTQTFSFEYFEKKKFYLSKLIFPKR